MSRLEPSSLKRPPKTQQSRAKTTSNVDAVPLLNEESACQLRGDDGRASAADSQDGDASTRPERDSSHSDGHADLKAKFRESIEVAQ